MLKKIKNKNFYGGLLLAIPFAYPRAPYYILSFVVFIMSINDIPWKNKSKDIYIILTMIVWTIFCSLLSPYSEHIELIRVIGSGFFYILILYYSSISDIESFYEGFLFVVRITCVYIIVVFFLSGQQFNIELFYTWDYDSTLASEEFTGRMWGRRFIYDWPNFLAFLLGLGLLLEYAINKRYIWLLIITFSILLTTSRTGLLAIIFVFILITWPEKIKNNLIKYSIVIALFTLLAQIFLVGDVNIFNTASVSNKALEERLTRTGDREGLFLYAFNIFMENPVFGIGSILFDINTVGSIIESFHNTYLEMLVRYGIFGLIFWLLIIKPDIYKMISNRTYLIIILYFFTSALFNNIFKHPHLYMLYGVIAYIGIPAKDQSKRKIIFSAKGSGKE